ncbi:MAG: SRPBCC domain-containing protein [Pseudomonadota bacterium]
MKVEASADIGAPPDVVWKILTDPARLTAGTGVLKLEGRPSQGARLKLWSEVDPKRAFALRVVTFEPHALMVWRGGMPLGLFIGERRIELAGTARGTQLDLSESFTGLMAPLITRSMPDLRPSMEKFVRAVARMAEEDAG